MLSFMSLTLQHFFCKRSTINRLLTSHKIIFQVHEVVRGEILEQILNRVVTKATAPVSHIMGMEIKLLSHLVHRARILVIML